MIPTQIDHFYTYGDIYETLETCQELEMKLGRLKRLHVLSEQEWATSMSNIADIRARLESHIIGGG